MRHLAATRRIEENIRRLAERRNIVISAPRCGRPALAKSSQTRPSYQAGAAAPFMSLGDTIERPTTTRPIPRPVRDALVVRFAGDSGDGVQLAGHQFATATAAEGADL